MKRIRCLKCKNNIVFDESRRNEDGSIIVICPDCQHRFGIRIKSTQEGDAASPEAVGEIAVIENVFHYKQEIPIYMGRNTIGRNMKGNDITCPIHTDDPSVDLTHCIIEVSRDKRNRLKYVLRDGPSYTGTFVDNDILGENERRVIDDGTLFTIGATSVILRTLNKDEC